ncbi:MAG: hypothetical protein M1828_004037 [Chrysothrix sp. TS-e1954]|nr:MAG: hypothetical protein M1828_004037 [Chrysothrix sp. TS-e1954]
MPRANQFDKKTSTTYALVSRPQNDALIHDDTVSSHVFTEIAGPSHRGDHSKIKHRGDLEDEFGLPGTVRENEGEAAEHGIYYDDTSYDYMQHMRDLGDGAGGNTAWVEAPQVKQKGKGKQKLEDAMRSMKLGGEEAQERLDDESVLSRAQNHATSRTAYQGQQDIPDAIAGFQPEMDPRLREVLEALDDEEYVDDEDDTFAELAEEGFEVDQDEWEATGLADDDEGWDSDDTTKPVKEYKLDATNLPNPSDPQDADGDFLASFTKSKATDLPPANLPSTTPTAPAPQISRPQPAASDLASTTSMLTAGRRKKRKGALTFSTGFSMTSSALARTEPLTTLDARFDKIAASYLDDIGEDDDDMDDETTSLASGITANSHASARSNFTANSTASRRSAFTSRGGEDEGPPRLASAGFQAAMDEYLSSNRPGQKERKMKKGGKAGVWGGQSGLEQLDEIRKGLGPARMGDNRAVVG